MPLKNKVTHNTYCNFYTCGPRVSPTITAVALCQKKRWMPLHQGIATIRLGGMKTGMKSSYDLLHPKDGDGLGT
jgi:glutamate dehydrogenase/leucine dehydrogenase